MILKSLVILITLTGSFGKEEDADWKKSQAHTFYDQRQTGKYNLNVNIKDVQFFSVSDSLGSIGDYSSYDDYGDYAPGEGDEDYNTSHLTVNPIFALLGSKPTKPSTTTTSTEKSSIESSTSPAIITENENSSSENKVESTVVVVGQTTSKPASEDAATTTTTTSINKSPLKVNETIEYDEIPVEVLYYRANQQQQQQQQKNMKTPIVIANNHSNRRKFKRRHPSVQIIDGGKKNVRVVESEHPTVRLCGRGEFRDNLGRCRVRVKRNNNNSGVKGIFKLFKNFFPIKDDSA